MTHQMKLLHEPFTKIKNGTKTIEMRLNDAKRSLLNLGDEIEFRDSSNNEKLVCEVLNLYKYKNFEELYANHDKRSIGYLDVDEANPNDMLNYYKKEDIKELGVLAIKIKPVGRF